MLRVNLSVAIVAMTANKTHTHENGTIAVVRHSLFDFEQPLGNIVKHSKISKIVNSIIVNRNFQLCAYSTLSNSTTVWNKRTGERSL